MITNFYRIASEIAYMESIKIIFGKRLKAELDKRSWSQAYFADRLKTSRSNVSLWIQGKTSPHLEMLEVIGKELQLDPFKLITPIESERGEERAAIFTDDALLKIIEELGYIPPKRLRRAEKL